MKFKIKDIEKKLGKKIKKDFISIGFDFATRAGICNITTNKIMLQIETAFVDFSDLDKKSKYSAMLKTAESLIDNQDIAIVENVFVGFSRNGSLELAKYHGLVLSECIRKDVDYDTPTAKKCRSKFNIQKEKKSHTWKKAVAMWLQNNLEINLEGDEDASDAVILSLFGIVED